MSESAFSCPMCAHDLSLEQLEWDTPLTCPGCSRLYLGETFAAGIRNPGIGEAPQRIRDISEASCLVHPGNQASRICSSCGGFMCELCALDLPTGLSCPDCFEAGAIAPVSDRTRRMWGNIVLLLAFGPILVWPISALAAPAGIVVAIYGWKKPGSLTGRGRWRLWVGLIFCIAITLAWASFVLELVLDSTGS